MRNLVFLLLLSMGSFAQKDTIPLKHAGVMQIGGQTLVSLNYEYSILAHKHFLLNTNIGIGLNKNSNDQDPDDTAIFGIHSGVILLTGFYPFYLEIGINPTTYFYRSMSFVNLNSWFGLRFYTLKERKFFFSLGYSPRLYTTFTDANNRFFNSLVGVKFAYRF